MPPLLPRWLLLPVSTDCADWVVDGRARLDALPGVSNVVGLDEAGRGRWASEGRLGAARERALFTPSKGLATSRPGEKPCGAEGVLARGTEAR